MDQNKLFAYVSNRPYGNPKGFRGLSLYAFDTRTGEMQRVERAVPDIPFNMSFIDKKRDILYALDESGALPGLSAGGGGRVFAYRINPVNGALSQISVANTFCPNPSFATLDSTGRYLVVSNHSTRSAVTKVSRDAFGKFRLDVIRDDAVVTLFAVNDDGSIGEMLDAVHHVCTGVGERHPHPHSAVMSPSGRLFAVCDKGTDKLYMYRIDREKNRLLLCGEPFQDEPGSMPRYCVFHPTQPYLFINHEGDTIIRALRYTQDGALEPVCAIDTLPPGWTGERGAKVEQQDLKISADGGLLYDVVRGPEAIAVIAIDKATGMLSLVQSQGIDGRWARGCALTPDERFLVAACPESGTLEIFSVNEDGTLSPTGKKSAEASAAYITFFRPDLI